MRNLLMPGRPLKLNGLPNTAISLKGHLQPDTRRDTLEKIIEINNRFQLEFIVEESNADRTQPESVFLIERPVPVNQVGKGEPHRYAQPD
jgi:hypothetical protein